VSDQGRPTEGNRMWYGLGLIYLALLVTLGV